MNDDVQVPIKNILREGRESLWSKAYQKFKADRVGVVAFVIVLIYFFIAVGVWLGFFGQGWEELVAEEGRLPPSSKFWFGTNINGQDVFKRAVYSTKTAFEVGISVSILSSVVGAFLGAISGYYNRTWIDEFIIWIYSCLDTIPFYLFVAAVAFALQNNPYAMHIALIVTSWTGTARLVRGEFIKLKRLEFTEAARALAVPTPRIIFKHLLPNTSHIILVQMSIIFVAAVKTEVILSFLGLGVKEGISWGLMIAESTSEVPNGIYNNFLAASGFMFVLVIAFNMFSDALQDALDPKKVLG